MKSKFILSILSLLITLLPYEVRSKEIKYLKIGKDAFAFHEEKFPEKWIKLTPPVIADSEIFIEMIGIPNIAKINELKLGILRSNGIKNAVALFHDGYRLITFDPVWAKAVTPEFYLVPGHEAGHHFCGHTIGKIKTSRRKAELVADRFSGAAIKRFEIYHNKSFIQEALKVANKKYPVLGTRSYPPRSERIKAIMKGYKEGSSCGSLLPSIRGFSRQPR